MPFLPLRRLFNRAQFRAVAENTMWLFIDRVLRMAVNLVVTVAVARYLGPEGFGLINFAAAFVSLFGILAGLGLDNVVVRDIVRHPDEAKSILASAFVMRLIGSVLSIILSVVGIFIMRPSDIAAQGAVIILAVASIFRCIDTLELWFQARIQSKFPIQGKTAVFLALVGYRLALIWSGAGLLAFVWAEVISAGLTAVALVFIYRRSGERFAGWKATGSRMRRLLSESWPLMISGLAILIYLRINQVMLQGMLDSEAVGQFAAALRLSEVWYFVPMAMVGSVFPAIVALRERDRKLYEHRMAQLFSLMAAISLALAIPMTFLSGTVVSLIWGSKYQSAGPILAVHIWSAIFVFWGVAQEPWNMAEGLQRLTVGRTVLGAIVNVGLNYVLIPRYAGLGAAVATVISYAISSWMSNLMHPRTRPIFFMQLRSLLFYRYFRSAR